MRIGPPRAPAERLTDELRAVLSDAHRDVGATSAIPAGINVLSVRVHHQVAHAEGQRMSRDKG